MAKTTQEIEQGVQAMVANWNGYRGRWAQLACWDRDDVLALHTQENSLAKRYSKSRGDVITDNAMMEAMNLKHGLIPWWDPKIEPGERETRMSMFYAKIYSTWASVVRRHIEAELRDESRDKSKDFLDRKVLHECDLAVHQLGERPDRYSPQDQRKARVVQQAKEVYGH